MKTCFKQEKNRDRCEKTTSANVQVADLKLAGSTWKSSKSLDFATGDMRPGLRERKTLNGESTVCSMP